MLNSEEIDRIATEVATANLPPGAVLQVTSAPAYGPDREPVLSVLVVIRASSMAEVTGTQAVHTLSRMQDRLQDTGETRFAHVEYATDEELAADGGS